MGVCNPMRQNRGRRGVSQEKNSSPHTKEVKSLSIPSSIKSPRLIPLTIKAQLARVHFSSRSVRLPVHQIRGGHRRSKWIILEAKTAKQQFTIGRREIEKCRSQQNYTTGKRTTELNSRRCDILDAAIVRSPMCLLSLC